MTPQERLGWLKARLGTMGPLELLTRLDDAAKQLALQASLGRVTRRAHRQSKSPDPEVRAPELNGQLDRFQGELQGRILAHAAEWRDHRVNFFALHNFSLGDSINWHRDYSSDIVGPMKHSGLINHRDTTVAGNIKYIWELNRLQHLVLLALASSWTGNDAYGQEIEEQTLSWQAQNPFMKGVNWKSPLEAAMRLISWALVSFLTARSNQAGKIFHENLLETFYQHQYLIRTFYSKHSSANNHLIGEMAGLYIASVFWPWYQESAAWRSFAREKLIQESRRQVEPDGVSKERATEYQMFVLEFFILAGALGHVIGDPFPAVYWERLQGMMVFLSAISDRAGNLPMFGDGDSGQVVWLPETLPERARALYRLGECHDEMGLRSNLRSVLLLWGSNPADIPLRPVGRTATSFQAFPDGGYYVLTADCGSDNEIIVAFDAGPLGLAPLYAHGHADALSFWLSYGGHEFLIDPGTYCYYTEPGWRTYFRGTGAHNTVRVDGEDQSIAGGTFLWKHVANCRTECVEENAEFVEVLAFHDGYRRLQDPVIHRRGVRLFRQARKLVITDHLECRRPHTAEIFFHFSENCQVRQVGSHSFEAYNDGKRLSLLLDPRLTAELHRGSEQPICGWVSRTFGIKEPTFCLIARGTMTPSSQFATEMTLV